MCEKIERSKKLNYFSLSFTALYRLKSDFSWVLWRSENRNLCMPHRNGFTPFIPRARCRNARREKFRIKYTLNAFIRRNRGFCVLCYACVCLIIKKQVNWWAREREKDCVAVYNTFTHILQQHTRACWGKKARERKGKKLKIRVSMMREGKEKFSFLASFSVPICTSCERERRVSELCLLLGAK